MIWGSFRQNAPAPSSGSFRQIAAAQSDGGDCFFALRAPRNDGVYRLTATYLPSLRAKRSNLAICIEPMFVMAGLVPAIHAFLVARQGVDARHKAGHDDGEASAQNSASSFLLGGFFSEHVSSQAPSFRESRRPAAVGECPPEKTKGGEAPTGAGAERRTRGPPYGWACPFSGRERPAT
jgi:hypothetical protein